MTKQMNAITINHYGSANELHQENIDIPEIDNDEVLVHIAATSVNPIDWKAREGNLKGAYNWSFPIVLGWDLAGTIVKIGDKVTNFKIGDAVFARPDMYQDGKKGTYAEYAVVKSDKLAAKPKNLSYEEAAGVPLAALTAWQVIVDRLDIQPGDKLLIQGGAGGVGLFAIQIAKTRGAYVATTASAKNKDLLRSLGADEVVDYHTQDVAQVLENYDAVFDTVNHLEEGLAVLKTTGKLVTIAGHPTPEQQQNTPSATEWYLQTNGAELTQIGKLIEANKIKVIIDSQYPLTITGVRDAHHKSESHHATGKIIITNPQFKDKD